MEPKLSEQAAEALENPPYTVQELVDRLEAMPEKDLATWGVVPRLMLTRYIRELEKTPN